MQVLHITDLHIYPDDSNAPAVSGPHDFVHRWDGFSEVIAMADMIVVGGDISQSGNLPGYLTLKEKLDDVDIPNLICPGNHDDRIAMMEVFSNSVTSCRPFIQSSLEKDGALYVALDTKVDGKPWGEWCRERSAWLKQCLQASDASRVVVFCHHPLIDTSVAYLDEVAVKNGREDLLTMLHTDGRVDAIVYGHHHISKVVVDKDLIHIFSPSFSGKGTTSGVWGLAPEFGPGRNGLTCLTIDHDYGLSTQFLHI